MDDRNCGNCENYVAGLHRGEGVCIAKKGGFNGLQFEHVSANEGFSCDSYRPRKVRPMLSVKDMDHGPIQPPKEQETPPPLQPRNNNVKVGNIVGIEPKPIEGEWYVTAIGTTALLAINTKTQTERAFPQKQYNFRRLNN